MSKIQQSRGNSGRETVSKDARIEQDKLVSGALPEMISGRCDMHSLDTISQHWGRSVAEKVVEAFPDQQLYTCAAGISPSGVVHFGNFRDVMTSYVVARGLKEIGKKVRFLFSWDDYDRFRKVPAGMPEALRQHIGNPLSMVPAPFGDAESYARHFQLPFEQSMRDLGIEVEWRYQTQEYRKGRYDAQILFALSKRDVIADILLANMSEKGKEEKKIDPLEFKEGYYPIAVYSQFSGTDNTKVIGYDGASKIIYKCLDTGKIATVDLQEERIAKLSWKVDWPMRWGVEEVNFEPGGHDHASPGGSFDSAGIIAQAVFGRRPPVFVGYEFIGLKGLSGKMSGSKGGAMTPGDILEVYEPSLLKWLYTRKLPNQSFQIAFDTDVIRIYDEYDKARLEWLKGGLSTANVGALEYSGASKPKSVEASRLSFRQIVGMGQIVQWDLEKFAAIAEQVGSSDSRDELSQRLRCAKNYLYKFNPDQVINMLITPNSAYAANMGQDAVARIRQLVDALANRELGLKDIEGILYGIPKDLSLTQKENAPRQRAFFIDIYQLLLGAETGPRLPTFLWAADRDTVLQLLTGGLPKC